MDTADEAMGFLAIRQSKCQVRTDRAIVRQNVATATPCRSVWLACRFYENSQPAVKALYGRHTQQDK